MNINLQINRRTVFYSVLAVFCLVIVWVNFRIGGFAAGMSAVYSLGFWALIIWGVSAALRKYRQRNDPLPEPAPQRSSAPSPETSRGSERKGLRLNPVLVTAGIAVLVFCLYAGRGGSIVWDVVSGLFLGGIVAFVAYILYLYEGWRYTDTVVQVQGIRHSGKKWEVTAYAPQFDRYVYFSLPENTPVEVTQQICVLVHVRYKPYWHGRVTSVRFDSLVSTDLKGRMSSTPPACGETPQVKAGKGRKVALQLVKGGKKS